MRSIAMSLVFLCSVPVFGVPAGGRELIEAVLASKDFDKIDKEMDSFYSLKQVQRLFGSDKSNELREKCRDLYSHSGAAVKVVYIHKTKPTKEYFFTTKNAPEDIRFCTEEVK